MKKLIMFAGLAFVLAACANEPAPAPVVNHTLPPKITLNVQTISLTDRTGIQPSNSPYNNNHFSPTISDAIKQWAGDRLQAGGQAGTAIVVIKDASLTSQGIATKQGVDSWFTRQQAVKYVAHAEVSIEANSGQGSYAMANAVATRSVSLPEDPTDIERQDAYYTLLNGLMKDLGENLEASIQTHMNGFLLSPAVYGSMAVPAGAAMPVIEPLEQDQHPIAVQSPRSAQNTSLSEVSQEQLPPPQAPVFGAPSASAVPSLASSPDSFGMDTGPAMAPRQVYNAPAAAPSGGPVTIPLSGGPLQ